MGKVFFLTNELTTRPTSNFVFCEFCGINHTLLGLRDICVMYFCVCYVGSSSVWSNLYIVDGEEKTYGGCEGPDAMYVKLISSDGHEFIVKREHALTSGTIKAMLSGPGEY